MEPGVDGVTASSAVGSSVDVAPPGGFSLPAFLFPTVWPFVYGLRSLSAVAATAWFVDTALVTALLLAPDPDRFMRLGGRTIMLVALALSAVRLGIAVYAGFVGNRLYWQRFPDKMSPADFRRRQVTWVAAGVTLLVASAVVGGLNPVWVTSHIRFGGQMSVCGVSFNPRGNSILMTPKTFAGHDNAARPLDPRSVDELAPGMYQAVPVRLYYSSRDWPETWLVIPGDNPTAAEGLGAQYRVSPTMFTKFSVNGSRVSDGAFREALAPYSGSEAQRAKRGKSPRFAIAVTRPGEIAEVGAEFVTAH